MNFDLVFEGGGAKGMVFVGAMQEFIKQGHTYDRLLGTSAGAITATLLAAGYTPQEMLEALNEKENGQPVFAGFMSPPLAFDEVAMQESATLALLRQIDLSFIPNLFDVEEKIDEKLAQALMKAAPNLFSWIEQGGWYSAHKFITWLERKLDEGLFQDSPRHFSQMTMKEYFAATQREISLVTSDTTGGHLLVLNHRTAPNLPVVRAVRMSMSIPMIWPEVEWQADWGLYQDKDISGHKLVDGGLLSNFPIELFVSNMPHITEVMGDKQSENVIGLLIDEDMPVAGAPIQASADPDFSIGNLQIMQRINRLINTTTGAHDKMVIEAFKRQVIHLPAKGYGTTEFDMSDARREALIKAGRMEMKDYLAHLAIAPFSPEADLPAEAIDHANRVADNILTW